MPVLDFTICSKEESVMITWNEIIGCALVLALLASGAQATPYSGKVELIARKAHVPSEQIQELRNQGHGWGEIAQMYGFKLGPLMREAHRPRCVCFVRNTCHPRFEHRDRFMRMHRPDCHLPRPIR